MNSMTNITPLPAAKSVPTLASSAMLVNLTIGNWTASKKDKNASRGLAAANGIQQKDLARAYKSLVDSAKLGFINSLIVRIHDINRNMTLDWAAKLRLLTTANYANHVKTITKLEQEYWAAVDDFIDTDYQWQASEMQLKLGAMYDAADYPSAEALRRKFYFRVEYFPVPSTGDFRVDLEQEAQDVLRRHYEKVYGDAIKSAMAGLWERMRIAVKGMAVQLDTQHERDPVTGKIKAKRGRIYDSRVTSMNDIIDMMDTCNVAGDPDMTQAANQLRAAFDGITTKEDIQSDTVRAETKKKMDAVIKSLPGLDWD
tara:strand:+ start:143 stop:1081 length:939 start_codon:yes stop_codon:yes gene_type:complete